MQNRQKDLAMAFFSVRETVPGHEGKTDSSIGKGIPDTYHQIDLMVHLLTLWNYDSVYGRLDLTIKHMATRIDGVSSIPPRLRPKLPKDKLDRLSIHLREMSALVADIDNALKVGPVPAELQVFVDRRNMKFLDLRALFEKKFLFDDPTSATSQVVKCWRKIQTVAGNHVCFPWMVIQTDSSADVIAPAVMDRHIAGIGQYTLLDIYTLSAENKELVAAVIYVRRWQILTRTDSKKIKVLKASGKSKLRGGGGSGANDKKCMNIGGHNGCVDYAGTFCNQDANGNCTVASA